MPVPTGRRTAVRAAALLAVSLAGCAPAATRPSTPATPANPLPAPAAARAADAGDFRLTVDNLMRGELLVGTSPSEVRWAEDSRSVWFRWRDPESGDTTTALWRVAVEGGAAEPVPDSLAARLAPAVRGVWSRDRARRAVERDGDIFVVEADGRERRVTDTPARERTPHLSPDGRTVYFLAGSDVFAVDLAGGPLRQLTDLRAADAPAKKPAAGQKKFLEEQEKELLAVVRERAEEREHRERVDSLRTRVRPTWIGRGRRVTSAEISPSGRLLLLGVADTAADRQTIVPNFVTESGYTEPLTVRAKVGDAQRGQRAAIVDLATGKLTWLEAEPKERARSWMPIGWAPASDRALVMAIADDYKDRWIYVAGADGRAAPVDHLHDEAWVGGPAFYALGWLPGGADGRGERVYFVSERTGYSHLYTVPAEGGRAQAVTAGQWEVTDVQLAPGADRFYLTTSETHPGERHLYSVSVDGGERTRITALAGWNESLVSPDGRHLAVLHSEPDSPPELYLAPLAPLSEARRVTRSTTAEFQRGPWIRPELVQVPASDGAKVWARIYRPQDLGARPNGAAVIFVHGAGYLQNAHLGWSTYYREYMFHHLLAARGYTVLDMDYRGSSGYGRDWRVGIYRHMGGKDLSDHVDGARWLAEHEGVDAKRIGIYGGSYGGFITLMALFTEPDVFRSGAALRSVTDWAHYNHGYTTRILNQPHDDPEAYRRSSPIYFAEGLRGDLLIAHGMVDTNVHFQDVVRLAQRLIELGKTNWEMAVYPVENHAFTRPDSWTDEYRRILELFERTLR